MPLTQQEIERRIAQDLLKKYKATVTDRDVAEALDAADRGRLNRLRSFYTRSTYDALGKEVAAIIDDFLIPKAKREAGLMFDADGCLDLTDLDRWLG